METGDRGLTWNKRDVLIRAGVVLMVALLCVTYVQPGWAAEESSGASPEGAGLQAASWLLTIPYGAVKVAFALTDGIVGGLDWALTGGNMEAAKTVWTTSMYGDYIVRPEHLNGEKRIRFLGVVSDKPTP